MQFEHSLGLGGESLCVGRSLFAICIAHCSHFGTLVTSKGNPSSQCVTVHPVPKFRSCHKAIMVTTGRAQLFVTHFVCFTHIEPINTTGRRSCEVTFVIEILTSSTNYASSQTGFTRKLRSLQKRLCAFIICALFALNPLW